MSIQKFEHPRTKKIISFEWDDTQGDPTPDVFDELEALEDSAGEVMAPPPVPKLSPEQEQARKAWDFQVHPSKSHFTIKSPETGKLLKGSVPKDKKAIGQEDINALMQIEKDFSETGADFAKSLEKPEDRIVPPPKLGLGMLQDTKIPENIQDILKTPAGEAGMKKGAKESMGTAMVPAVVLGKAAGYGMARVGEEVVQAAIGTPLQEQFKTTWATAQDPLTMATDGIKIAAAASPLAAAFVDKPEELLAATPAGQVALAGMDPESRSRYFDAHPLLAATEMGGDLALQLGAGLGAGGVGLSGGTTRSATIVKHLGWVVDPVNKLQFLAQEKATRSLAKAQELGLKELPKTVADDLVKDQEVLKKIQELQQAVATGNTAAAAERWSGRLFLPGMAAGTVEGLDAALDENLPNDQRLMGLTGAIQSGGFTMLALYHATRQARNPQAGDFVSDPIMRGAMEKVLAAKAPKDAEAATAFLRKQWKEYDAAQAVKAEEARKAEAALAAKQAEADAQLERFNTQLQDEMAPPVNPRGARIQRPVAMEETVTPPPPVAAEAPLSAEAPPVDIASLRSAEEAALTELSQAEAQFGEGSPEAVAAKQKAQAAAQERFMAEASQPQEGARKEAGLPGLTRGKAKPTWVADEVASLGEVIERGGTKFTDWEAGLSPEKKPFAREIWAEAHKLLAEEGAKPIVDIPYEERYFGIEPAEDIEALSSPERTRVLEHERMNGPDVGTKAEELSDEQRMDIAEQVTKDFEAGESKRDLDITVESIDKKGFDKDLSEADQAALIQTYSHPVVLKMARVMERLGRGLGRTVLERPNKQRPVFGTGEGFQGYLSGGIIGMNPLEVAKALVSRGFKGEELKNIFMSFLADTYVHENIHKRFGLEHTDPVANEKFKEKNTKYQTASREVKKMLTALLSGTKDDLTPADIEVMAEQYSKLRINPEGETSAQQQAQGKKAKGRNKVLASELPAFSELPEKGFLQRKLEERLARARGEKPLPVPRASKYRPAPEAPKGMSPSEAKRVLQEVGERERAEALKDPEYQKQLADEAKAAEEQARIDKLNKAAHTRALKTPARHIGVGEGGREGFSTAAPEGSEIAPPPKVEAPKAPKVEKPASAPEALKGMEADIDAEIKDAQAKVAKMTDGKAARGVLEDAQNALIADINMLHENEAIDAGVAETLKARVRKGMFPRDIVAPPPKVDTTPRLAPKKASEAGRVDPGVTMAIIGAGIGGTIGGVPGALVGGLAGGAMWSALSRAAQGVKKGGKPVGKMSLPELEAFRREHEGTEHWAVEKARDIQTIWLSATVGPIDTIWRNVVQGGAQGGLLAMSDTARAFSYAVGLKTPETEDSFYRTLHRAGRIAGMDLLRTMGDTVHKTMEGVTLGEGKTKDRKLKILERMAKRFVDVDLNDRYNLVMSGEVEIGRGKTRQLRPAERVGRAMMLGASAVERSMRVSIMERYLAPIMAREGLTSDKSGYAKLLKKSLKDDALKLRIIEAMGKAESIALHRTKGLGSKQGGRIEKLMRFFEDVPLIPRLFVTQFPNYFINNFLTNIVETNGVLMRIGDALGVSPERGSARKHTAYARIMELALQEATVKKQSRTALDAWMAQNGTDYAAAKALHHTKRTAAQKQLIQDGNTLLQDYQVAKKAYGQHQEKLKKEFKSGYMGKDFSNQLRIMGALTMALGYAIGMQRTDDEQGPYDFTVGKDKAGKKKVKSLFPILAEFAPMWLIGDVMARRRKGSTYYGKDDQSFWDSRLATEIKALFTGTGRPIATDSDAGAVLEAFMTKEKSDDWQKVARKWAGNVGAQFGRGGTIGDVGRVVKSPKTKTRPDVAPGGEKESYGGVPQSFYRGIKGKYTEEGLTPSYDATSGDVRKALSLPEVLGNFGLSEREESPITRFLNTHPEAKKGFLRAVTGKKEWDEKFFAGVKRKLEVPFIKKGDVKLTIPQMLEDPSFSDAEKEALLSSHMGKAVEGLETGLQREALKRKDPMMIPPPLRKKLGEYEEKRKMDRDLRLEKRHFPREPRPLRRFEKKKLDQLMPEDITPIPISRWGGAGEVDRTANVGGPSPKLLSDASKRHGVDEKLLRAVIKVESGGKKGAVSHKGARGYMQVMPSTFRAFGGKDPHNAWENVMVGTKYLKHLLDMFEGDVEKALAAYNAGPSRVRSGRPLPGETVRYVQKVMAAYD